MEKVCNQCKLLKPLTEYIRDNRVKSGRGSKCYKCVNAITRKYFANNPEARARSRSYINAWYKRNATSQNRRMKWIMIKRKYGLTEDDYITLLKKQNNCCAICFSEDPIIGNTFSIDHDHTTGAVRGLLCMKCNSGIGFFDDDVERIIRAS